MYVLFLCVLLTVVCLYYDLANETTDISSINTNNLRYAGYAITTITFIPNTTIHVSVYQGNR